MSTQQNPLVQAEQFRLNGNLAQAEQIYRSIINQNPDSHAAYHGLALLANDAGKPGVAIDMVRNAIALNDQIGLYHSNLCEMCRRQGLLQEAIAAGTKAANLNPHNPEFKYNLALAHADSNDLESAIRIYRELLAIKPDHNLACNNLGAALEQAGQVDEALEYYKKAVEIDPNHSEAHNNLGAIYSERGQLDEARKCFTASIRANPEFIEPHYNLSSLKSYTVNDPDLTSLKKLSKKVSSLPVDAQTRYYFALGKAFEDVAEYDDAFQAYQRGNTMKFATFNYNEKQADRIINRIKRDFSDEMFRSIGKRGIDDVTPVFIVGMPRSGTSLIEQILASHYNIYGAGELKFMDEIIHRHRRSNKPAPGRQEQLTELDYQAMASEYLAEIKKIDSAAKFITDKMPANFFYIGFIHLMFPNAKIIHSMRDPMDSCFSCYAKLFNETMDFAYDLGTLGRYYVRYMQLMQHWHEVLPENVVQDIKYEDVVSDIEGETRKMLDFLGLDWDEHCLEFYNNERNVRTASVAQVRKPLYSSSIGRWKHFENVLQPLQDIVGPYRNKNNGT